MKCVGRMGYSSSILLWKSFRLSSRNTCQRAFRSTDVRTLESLDCDLSPSFSKSSVKQTKLAIYYSIIIPAGDSNERQRRSTKGRYAT
jgi:hypothetical protein